MAKLLSFERVGNRLEKTWLHYGDDGKQKITVETSEDVEPTFKWIKARAQQSNKKDFFRPKASIPRTLVDEMCKTNAVLWGITPREVFSELMQARTDRAKKVWKLLTEGSDYSKLQARSYR